MFGDMIEFLEIESMEVLHFLELKDGAAMIAKIELKDPKTKIEDAFRNHNPEVELLDRDKFGMGTYFIKVRVARKGPSPEVVVRKDILAIGGYFSTPFEFRNGAIKVSFMGSAKQIKQFIEVLEKTKLQYRVASIEDAKFAWKNPLERLTPKQRRILSTAYYLGYYDIPKKTSIERLGKMLHLSPSTLDVKLRKGERHLFAMP